MKTNKKVNPYEKKQKRKIKISRKQWIATLSLLGVVAILAGIIVMSGLGGGSHAGHNHGDEGNTTATDEHGHPIGSHDTVPTDAHGHPAGSHGSTDTSALRFQPYTNTDGTYGFAVYNSKNVLLTKQDKLPYAPYQDTEDSSGYSVIYCKTAAPTEGGYTSGLSIYCDEKNQRVSDALHGVLATDGTRVAYCSEDDTTVIVQDLFDKNAYCKEYPLPNVVKNGNQTVKHARLSADSKTVMVTYTIDEEGLTANHSIKLYE